MHLWGNPFFYSSVPEIRELYSEANANSGKPTPSSSIGKIGR